MFLQLVFSIVVLGIVLVLARDQITSLWRANVHRQRIRALANRNRRSSRARAPSSSARLVQRSNASNTTFSTVHLNSPLVTITPARAHARSNIPTRLRTLRPAEIDALTPYAWRKKSHTPSLGMGMGVGSVSNGANLMTATSPAYVPESRIMDSSVSRTQEQYHPNPRDRYRTPALDAPPVFSRTPFEEGYGDEDIRSKRQRDEEVAENSLHLSTRRRDGDHKKPRLLSNRRQTLLVKRRAENMHPCK